jgi:ATP-dependent RNA helicase RhlE
VGQVRSIVFVSFQHGLTAARPATPAQSAAAPETLQFDQLGLTPDLLRTVAAQGYTEPTPVQARSIPIVLSGRDLLASAQTGTGKTAAFVLPILQLLDASRKNLRIETPTPGRRLPRGASGLPIRCLVLTPTRELALQIEESVRTYSAARPVGSVTIYGGVGFEPQVRNLRNGPEIVVATPGRLLDHAGQGTIDLSHVEILVLDEADRMLDMGFIRDIRRILTLIPKQRQNLLFSATFSDDIRELAGGMMNEAAEVDVAPRNAAIELVRQVVYPVDRERKRELLSHLISSGRIDRALVFTRTKHGANHLAEQLVRDGILASAIHGNKSQAQRVRALDDFKAGRVAILVATEIAARGLDIDGLPHVVNFELPMVPQDYVHRIGRTGRAGMEGDAVSLVCVDETFLLSDIEKVLRQQIRREIVPGFEVDPSIRREPIRQRSDGARPGSGRQGAGRRPMVRVAPPAGFAPTHVVAGRQPVEYHAAAPRFDSPAPVRFEPPIRSASAPGRGPAPDRGAVPAKPAHAPQYRPSPGAPAYRQSGPRPAAAGSAYRPGIGAGHPMPAQSGRPAQGSGRAMPSGRPAPSAGRPAPYARPNQGPRSPYGARPEGARPTVGARQFEGARQFDGQRAASGGRPTPSGRPFSGPRPIGNGRPANRNEAFVSLPGERITRRENRQG